MARRDEGRALAPTAPSRTPPADVGRTSGPASTRRPAFTGADPLGAFHRMPCRTACHGHRAELRLGVIKSDAGYLLAHAWVESEGQIVVGDVRGLSRYKPLPALPTP